MNNYPIPDLLISTRESSPFRLERRARDGAAELAQPDGKLFGWTGLLLLQPPYRRADSRIGDATEPLLELLSTEIDELTIGPVPVSDAAQEGIRLARLIGQL